MPETERSQATNLETQKQNKVDRNALITSEHVFPKMIDGTEKPKISLKFAKRAARYNEFGYNFCSKLKSKVVII